MEESVKRPAKIDTDEDLLNQQEEFFRERKKPSAQFVSKKAENVKNDFERNNTFQAEKSSIESDHKNLEIMEDIILDVQEHGISSEPFVFKPPSTNLTNIKQLIDRNTKVSKFASQRKSQSIFVQMLSSSSDKNTTTECSSILIDGSGLPVDFKNSEVEKIHEENLAKLSAMSKEEIFKYQEQLRNHLSPKTLSFIKKRKDMKKMQVFCNSPKNIGERSNLNMTDESEGILPVKVLRNEGNKECDALIIDKLYPDKSEDTTQQNSINVEANKNRKKNDYEIPEETRELIDGENRGLWRNMNKIEKEKLEWMTDLPQPKPIDIKTGYTARFDFEGKLIYHEANIPVYKGLHHHGKEPEVPGYSLEELFLLARSSLQSQRITALNTIAHILENNWYGMMDKCFDVPLLPLLLNAGIVPLLRWALDDTSLTSIAATITSIHSLLISKIDEACLYKTFCWLNGHFVPQLEPQGLEEPNIVLEELTDADLIRLDVVKGFLRIDILPRFMYILKVMCPPPLVCNLIFEICARLAQHSSDSAIQVFEHPGLLKLVFKKFLPLNWHFIDSNTLTDTVDYSSPSYSALKLMRIIASMSKELAIILVEEYDIMSNILFYLTVQPLDGKLHPQDMQLLVMETLKIWHTYLCYGLGFNVFLDLFPVFLKQLDFCLNLDLNCDANKHVKDFDYASHLFKAFEAVSVIASEHKSDNASSTAVNVVFKKSLICLKKWIWQFSQDKVSSLQITLLATCMSFIVTYCRKSHDGLTCEDWKPCSAAKDVFDKYLMPAMKSNTFLNILKEFRSFSLYLAPEINGNIRDGETIVSLGSVMYGDDIVPNLKEGTPLPLLSAILNYILMYKNFFHDSGNECLEIIFCAPVIDYLKAVTSKKIKSSCWFLKYETFYLYQLIYLSSYRTSESAVCHETAIALLPSFSSPEECLIEELFENIIFHHDTIMKLASQLQALNATLKCDLLSLISRLPVVAKCYSTCFLNIETTEKSRNALFRSKNLESLFCLSTPNTLVGQDWCFMPILSLYRKRREHRKGRENLTAEETLLVTSCLQWIYLCHILNIPVLQKIPTSSEFYYLCLVFLLDEDLFRDEKVKYFLANCVAIILEQKKLDLAKINWNNIKTFDDIYLEMLIQYEAVSYGDETFGSFLAVPLQQNFPIQWKKLLLLEHTAVLNFLRVPLTKVLVPLENYLEPVETDIDILSVYLKFLATGHLNHRRCPLLYLMAVHHIHKFIFMQSDHQTKFQKILLSNLLKSKKDLKKIILLYSNVNETADYGFDIAERISLENQNHLNNIMGMFVNI